MIIKRKLYSYIDEERVFGEVKRANKAAKGAALKKVGTGITVSQDEINKMRERIEGSDFSKRLDELAEVEKKRPVYNNAEIKEMVKTKKAREAGRSISDKFEIIKGKKQKLNFDTLSENGNRRLREHKLDQYKSDKHLKKMLNEFQERELEREEKSARRAAEWKAEDKAAKKAAKLRASRVKKANELRAKKAFAKNAKIGAGIVAGSAALGAGAYLYNKNKKKN